MGCWWCVDGASRGVKASVKGEGASRVDPGRLKYHCICWIKESVSYWLYGN
jgi:hypothetical protein